jgi:hypothetical protein
MITCGHVVICEAQFVIKFIACFALLKKIFKYLMKFMIIGCCCTV